MLATWHKARWVVACIALWLIFEIWISWEAFCHHPEKYDASGYASEKYECAFRGPVMSIVSGLYDWWRHTFHQADDYVALFTALLFVSTVALWLATRKLWRITERTLTELERPHLFILDYNWLLTEKAKSEGHKCGFIYTVANGGKLGAFIKSVKIGTRFGRTIPPLSDAPAINDLLTAPLIGGGEQRHIVEGFIEEDEHSVLHECQIRGGLARIPAIAFKTQGVITKISIEYDGPVTKGHVTTVCWEWHPVKYAFSQYGGPEHNQRT